MKIKRLVTGGLATLAAGAALIGGGLAAATFDQGLGQFVKVTDSTLSSPVIVVGANAQTIDVVAAADIAASLVSNYAVTEKTIPGTGAETSVTNGVLIKSQKDYVWLKTSFNDVKQTLTSSDLPNLLAKGTVDLNDGTQIKYEQLITLGSHQVNYNADPEDVEEPVLNVLFDTTTTYTLTVNFLGGLDTSKVDANTEIKLFGKNFKFGPNPSNTTITLYSQTGTQTITIGNAPGVSDSATINVGGVDYTITFLGWDPNNTNTASVKISYGGTTTTKSWSEGSTYTLPGSSTQVYISDVSVIATGAQSQSGSMEIFIGTDKLELNDNDGSVKKNDNTLDHVTVNFDVSGSKINSITFTVAPDEDTYLLDGGKYADPLFGSFKFALNGMTPGFTDASRDMIKIAKSGKDKVKITFTNNDDTRYSLDMMYYSSGWKLGDGTRTLHVLEGNVSNSSDDDWIAKNEYFVVTDGTTKSYVFKYTGYDDTNKILTFEDQGTKTKYEASYTGSGDPRNATLNIGAMQVDVKYSASSHKVMVDLNDDGDITKGDEAYLLSKNGAKLNLTQAGNVTFSEMKLYGIGDYEPSGASYKFVTTYDTGASEISTINFAQTYSTISGGQVGSEKLYRYLSDYGTYFVLDTDADTVTIYYPGNRPAYVNVGVGEDPTISVSAGTAGGTYKAAVPITNPISKLDNEISTTALNNDLILVGGPCANTLVKQLLDTAWNTSNSCDYWLTQHPTLKNSGNGLVKIIENAFGSGHKALIVAGMTGQDTRNLVANKVIKPSVFAGLDTNEYIGPVA